MHACSQTFRHIAQVILQTTDHKVNHFSLLTIRFVRSTTDFTAHEK